MPSSPSYKPPTVPTLHSNQNAPDALRLLIAQRRLYRKAKRWLAARWLGFVVIGIAAPVVSTVWPNCAAVAGAAAGVWIFLGRTWLLTSQEIITARAAAIQEQFDLLVFGMPSVERATHRSSPEEISLIVGGDSQVRVVAGDEHLLDWYPFKGKDGTIAIGIAQRANVAYTDSLLKTTVSAWSMVIAVWLMALTIFAIAAGLTLGEFVLGVGLPILPAALDAIQLFNGVRRSSADKADLAQEIEDRLAGVPNSVRPHDLLVWQSRLFELRRSAPEVPDFLYKLRRSVNERAMHAGAKELSRKASRNR